MVSNTLEVNKFLAREFLTHSWDHVRHTILKLFFWRRPWHKLSDAHEIFWRFHVLSFDAFKNRVRQPSIIFNYFKHQTRCTTRTTQCSISTIICKTNQTHQFQTLPTHQRPNHPQLWWSTQLLQQNFKTTNQILKIMTFAILLTTKFKRPWLSHKSRLRQTSQSNNKMYIKFSQRSWVSRQ